MNDYPDLLVLGAGPCGLAAAYHAHAQGMHVQLLEGASRVGGRMRTTVEEFEGQRFVIEHGPAGWAGPTPETDAACEALGLTVLESQAADSHRYLVHEQQLVPFPQDPGALASHRVLTMRERVRAAAEKWADFAPDGKEETVEELFTRRFGMGAARKIFAPVVRGLFADDARTVSAPALIPGVVDAELQAGSLSKAWKQNADLFGAKVKNLPEGVGQLAEALAAPLGDQVHLNCMVDSAVREQGWWFLFREGEQVAVGRRLAVCLPVQQSAYVLREYLPGGQDSLARFVGADMASVSLLYRADRVPDPCAGFGVLAPADLPGPVLGVHFAHSIFREHIPEGWVLLRGLLGGDADPDILGRSDEELIDALVRELHQWVGAPDAPDRAWVQRIPGGVPHLGLGHQQAAADALHDFSKIDGLWVGGDAFFGIGIEPALVRGASIGRAAAAEHATA
ncbi:MAG: protoporphyrinogen oxidase [Planctomycetota bacterium]|jgi:oxygen-dependent protoporphyrinogen oxidase